LRGNLDGVAARDWTIAADDVLVRAARTVAFGTSSRSNPSRFGVRVTRNTLRKGLRVPGTSRAES
jgi:hypothetical protein